MADTPKPLTAGQRDILRKMADGWTMAVETGYGQPPYLQRGEFGKGGPIFESQETDAYFVIRAGLVERSGFACDCRLYAISPAGRAALRENSNAAE